MEYIRKAKEKDISRIAEILIFTKRMNYRSIFHDDIVSFGEMQVLPLAKTFLENLSLLDTYWVYDDEFVKGIIRIKDNQITELYVDVFFERQGIGKKLLEFAIKEKNANYLWVLEKNTLAISFYSRNGFQLSEERKLEDGTPEYIIKMVR